MEGLHPEAGQVSTLMARDKKPRGSDAKLVRLFALCNQSASAETTRELQQYLADRSNLVVAEAAKVVKEQAVAELTGDLVTAFDRMMVDPEERDKHCRAKIEIVEALNALDYSDPDLFVRGITHRQDIRFGDPPGQDAAGILRANCGIALARINAPGVVLLLTELLLDTDNTARAGAARALGGTGSLAAIPLLRYKVRVGDSLVDVIGECFASLLNLSFMESLPFVAEYLRARDSEIQSTAMFALAESRRPEACVVLKDFWPEASPNLHEALLTALAMSRLPVANDFLIRLIADRDSSAITAVSALAIHRHNPRITADIAAAVAINGRSSVRECFERKFPAE